MNSSGSTSLIVKETESAAPAAAVRTGVPSAGTITSLDSLREHLQYAIELEHSTIPPYLCALYSIEPGRNLEAVEVITSVVVEEMLHLLAANLLNAVGGRPRLDIPQMPPGYPRPLPHSDRSFEISLFRFGPDAIETFLKIEQPSPTSGPPESDSYETIGQFYESIKQGVRNLSVTLGEASVFWGDPTRQVTDEHIYGGGGHIIAVNNLDSALAARWRKSWNKGRGRTRPKCGMETATCFIPNETRSPITTAFRNLNLPKGIVAETPHGPDRPAIRFRSTGTQSG